MIRRWRARLAGLAILAALPVAAIGVTSVTGGVQRAEGGATSDQQLDQQLVVRDAHGDVLLATAVPEGRFALRYRNSVYGSLAEERFTVTSDGRIALQELAADDASVLAEYYDGRDVRPAGGAGALGWEARPAEPLVVGRLTLAATELGQRTLLVGQATVPLWELVDDASPTVTLTVEPPP